jgi:hypothetical protein
MPNNSVLYVCTGSEANKFYFGLDFFVWRYWLSIFGAPQTLHSQDLDLTSPDMKRVLVDWGVKVDIHKTNSARQKHKKCANLVMNTCITVYLCDYSLWIHVSLCICVTVCCEYMYHCVFVWLLSACLVFFPVNTCITVYVCDCCKWVWAKGHWVGCSNNQCKSVKRGNTCGSLSWEFYTEINIPPNVLCGNFKQLRLWYKTVRNFDVFIRSKYITQ